MVPAMCSNTFVRSSTVNLTVTCHVEVITDVVKSTVSDVIPPAVVKAQKAGQTTVDFSKTPSSGGNSGSKPDDGGNTGGGGVDENPLG